MALQREGTTAGQLLRLSQRQGMAARQAADDSGNLMVVAAIVFSSPHKPSHII
jgi:hypothetical protein